MIVDLTGGRPIYGSGGYYIDIKEVNRFFTHRDIPCEVDIGTSPTGRNINRFFNVETLIDSLAIGAAHYTTKEGLFLNFCLSQNYENTFLVSNKEIYLALSILDDPEQYMLAERDASWFIHVFKEYLKDKYNVCQEGSSVIIEADLKGALIEGYNIETKTIFEPKKPIQTEINFIYNRANSIFTDSGNLAIACANILEDSLHKPIVFKTKNGN